MKIIILYSPPMNGVEGQWDGKGKAWPKHKWGDIIKIFLKK